jgi:hypothetical protein
VVVRVSVSIPVKRCQLASEASTAILTDASGENCEPTLNIDSIHILLKPGSVGSEGKFSERKSEPDWLSGHVPFSDRTVQRAYGRHDRVFLSVFHS